MKKNKLILGSAGKKDSDSVTLDIDAKHHPDVVHDLDRIPWPFVDDQFREIVCHHVLEHLNDIAHIMSELYRICAKDGEIYIEVPHYTSLFANNPEHKLRFGYFALDGYIENGITKWMTTTKKFRIIERKITFHRTYRRYFLHKLFNRKPLLYERFWAYIIPAENIIFKLQPIK
ncbi:MAG: class I SAM-dependent methyltransferase [Omnitrophica bacterium]|nr:class I SAM-dependent methyltransferase [Candidatus Omnitrophota bacterium]